MLRIIKYKIVMFTITVTSLTVGALIVCLGSLEIYADIRERSLRNEETLYSTHKLIAFSILCCANVSVFANIVYMSLFALRGLRYTWYMGCNYFLYLLSELVSGLVIFTYFDYLNYPLGLAITAGTQAVLLFTITCIAEKIFAEVEILLAEDAGKILYVREVRKMKRRMKTKANCVRVSLHETGVNAGAGTSGVRGK